MASVFYIPCGLRDQSDPSYEAALSISPKVFETIDLAKEYAERCYAEDMEANIKEVQEDISFLLTQGEIDDSPTVTDRKAEQVVYATAWIKGLSWELVGGRWLARAEFTYGDPDNDGLWVVLEN
jgi:hypothetical protein